MLTKRIGSAALSLLVALSSAAIPASAAPGSVLTGYMGDVNADMHVDAADVAAVQSYMLNSGAVFDSTDISVADLDRDGSAAAPDLSILKRIVCGFAEAEGIYTEQPPVTDDKPIDPPIEILNASLPSQGEAKILIFSIEFPDCKFSSYKSAEELINIVFGPENSSSPYYPCESLTAYFDRSSYGVMQLSGECLTYTAQNSISVYNNDKVRIVEEAMNYYADKIDFTQFDGDGDGMIDCSSYFVPESASSDYWWPCSGGFGDPAFRVDGMSVGNIITGNTSPSNPSDYNGTMIHEMGHAMGLPDYYKYVDYGDIEGFHGDAGFARMDEATGDFCAFSKLMLGWYKPSQINVFDGSSPSVTYTIDGSQTNGGCVIIPGEKTDENGYFSEFFILEYVTKEGNYTNGWFNGSGVRVFHVEATLYRDAWGGCCLGYVDNGPLFKSHDGIRVIKLVNDGKGFTTSGGTISKSNCSDFGWYDASGQPTVDSGITISVGELSGGKCTVTISK